MPAPKKYIVRFRDNVDGDRVVIGLGYRMPSETNDWLGEVLAGGNVRFRVWMNRLLKLWSRRSRKRKIEVKSGGYSRVGGKIVYRVRNVLPREYNEVLDRLLSLDDDRLAISELEEVRNFRRLMY